VTSLELCKFQSASESSNDSLAFDKTDKKINEEQRLKTEVVTIENLDHNPDLILKLRIRQKTQQHSEEGFTTLQILS
jgi:hypothetical protein